MRFLPQSQILTTEFDAQLEAVREQVGRILERMYAQSAIRTAAAGFKAHKQPVATQENLNLLLFSGAMGAAPRTQDWFREALARDGSRGFHRNIPGLRIAALTEPQLCVVKGLLLLLDQGCADDQHIKNMIRGLKSLLSRM